MLKKKIVVTNKLKEFLWGLTMVILVSLFTYTVVKIFNEKSDVKYQASLEKINRDAEARRVLVNLQLDSTQRSIQRNYDAVLILNNDFNKYNQNLKIFQTDYLNSLNQLNKVKDETNYVPNNATPTEQSTYLSGYIYEPY